MNKTELTQIRSQQLGKLSEWVEETFNRCKSLEDYLVFFNDLLLGYQKNPQLKLDLESIRKGYYSCSSAALVASIWRNISLPESSLLLVDKDHVNIQEDRYHVLTALPILRLFTQDDIEADLENYRYNLPTETKVVDFKSYRTMGGQRVVYMAETPGSSIPQKYDVFFSVESYFDNRCDVFNYLKD